MLANPPAPPAATSLRRRVWMVLVVFGSLAALGCWWVIAEANSLPRHDGRALPEILYALGGGYGYREQPRAVAAVRAIGPDAMPYIVKRVAREPLRVRLFQVLESRASPAVRGRLVKLLDIHRLLAIDQGARLAIGELGTNAAPAADELMRAYRGSNYQRKALLAQLLPKVGPAVVPGLIPELTHPDLPTRSLAAFVVYQLGPQAEAAAPALVAGLEGANINHVELVAQTLGRLGPAAQEVVVILLGEDEPVERKTGLRAMRHLTPWLRWQTGRVVQLLDDPDLDVRLEAALVLGDWWPMPVEFWREKLAENPGAGARREELIASLNAVDEGQARWNAVLREGLAHPAPTARLAAAGCLLQKGPPDQEIVDCLEKLVKEGPPGQGPYLNPAMQLLDRARLTLLNGRP